MGTSTISVSKEIVNRINILSLIQTKFLKILSGFFILILVFCPNDSFAQYYPEPSVETDKLDYAPGETVNIKASGFIPNSIIEFQISDDPNDPGDDGEADVYTPFSIQDGGSGDLDGVVNGEIKTTWIIPTDNNNSGDGIPDAFNATLNLVALGYGEDEILYTEDDQMATATFTDGAQALWAWRTNGNSWNSGTTIQQANSIYAEDDAIPFRWTIKTGNPAPQLQEGIAYIIRIDWDFAGGTTNPNTYMIDYLTTWNDTQTSATGPFSDVFTGGNISTVPIPPDPELLPGVQAQAAGGVFTLYNIGSVTFVSGTPGDRYIETVFNASQTRKYIELSIIPNDGDGISGEFVEVAIAWGGHLGAESDYGLNKGANNFPGSSPQMLVDLNPTSSGDVRNLNLSPSAIVQQGKITIVKDAVPNSLQDFSFSTSSNATTIASSFIIDDDAGVTGADATYSNQKIFFGLSPGTYTFTEDAYSSWDLTGLTASESGPEDTTPGDISSTNLGTRTLSITVANGEAWTGTFVNEASTNEPPVANDDSSTGNTPGTAVTLDADLNDSDPDGNLDPATVNLDAASVGGTGSDTDSDGDIDQVVVSGEGTWNVDENGNVTFTPDTGFTGDPTPIDYTISDTEGAVSNVAIITIDYDQQPSLTIAKDQTNGPNPVTSAGDVIDYTVVVTNTGNQTLTNVNTSDVLPDGSAGTLSAAVETGGTGTNGDGLLDVGEVWTYTISYTVTQSDIDAGLTLTNTATVDTDQTEPQQDGADTPVDQQPSLTIAKDQTNGPNPVTSAGDVIDYTVVVTNTGNQTLTNVNTSDVLPDGSAGTLSAAVETGGTGTNGDGLLDVGEVWTYTISYTVTQSDIDAGLTLTNTATVDTDQTEPQQDGADTPVDQQPSLTIAKDQTNGPNPVTSAGDVIDYTVVVTNTGNQTLTNVNTSDVLPDGSAGTLSAAVETGGTGTNGDGLLDVGEVWTYTISYTVTQSDIDAGLTLTNTATVDTDQTEPQQDGADTPVDQQPSLTIAKDQTNGPNPVTSAGDVIDYTVVVTNTGNQTLTNVNTSDVLPDGSAGTLSAAVETGGTGTNGDGLLDVGEVWTYTISYTVTQSDIDAGLTLTNTATVDTDQTEPQQDGADTPVDQQPSLTIAKDQTNGPNPVTSAGDVIDYTVVVTNTGNQTLTNVNTSDVLPDGSAGTLSAAVETGGTGTNGDGLLDVGEVWTYTISYTVTQSDIDAGLTLTNTATVDTDQTEPQQDGADTPVDQQPSLTIAKDQTNGPNPVTSAGDVIDYTVVVTNTGNQTLTNVNTSDVLPDGSAGTLSAAVETGGTGTNGDGLLDVGEVWTYTISYTVTQSDIDAGLTLTNTATVDTDQTEPQQDGADTPVDQQPSLTIAKDQTNGPNPVTSAGDVIDYTVVVTNTGNQTLTNVNTSDVLPDGSAGTLSAAVETGGTGTNGDGLLDVGEVWTYTISYTVTQSDIDAGLTLTNTATVDTDQTEPQQDGADTPVDQQPSLTIAKDQTNGPNPVTSAGDVIDYTVVVTNTGNQTLTNVNTSDVLPDGSAGTLSAAVETGGTGTNGDGLLDVGEVWTYTISYTVTQSDIDAGLTLTNTATVDTDQTEPQQDGADTPVDQQPSLTIAKDQTNGPNPVTSAGDVIDYTVVVTNTGNQTLTNVNTSDVLPDGSAGTLSAAVETGGTGTNGDGLLDVGEVWTYTISYTVTQSDIDAGLTLTNTATVDTDQTEPQQDGADTPVDQQPSLTIAKDQTNGPNPVTSAGDVIDYTVVVTNTGNQTLTNVNTSDVLPDGSAGTLSAAVETGGTGTNGDGLLDVGEVWTYTISYTVTQSDIDAGLTLTNTATVDTDQTEPQQDGADTPVDQQPSLTIAKDQTNGPNPVTSAGDVIDYTVVVTNTGNQTLTNVNTSDVLPDGSAGTLSAAVETGGTGTNGDGLLDVGEVWTYTISYTVTQSDIDAGLTLTNTATVDTDQTEPQQDGADTPVDQQPSLTIAKDQTNGPNPVTSAGDVIDYTVVVTNTGNQTLTNVNTSDVLPDGSAGTLSAAVETGGTGTNGDGLLDVGEVWTYTISYTVTQSDIDAGLTLTNTATVDTDQTEPQQDGADTPVDQQPSLTIAKDQTNGPNPVTSAGDVIDYTVVVTNTGNQTLTNVNTSDVLPDGSAGTLSAAVETGGTGTNGDGLLDVGEVWTYTISYTVTQSDIDAGLTLTNTATVDTDQTEPQQDGADTPVDQQPSLTIAKDQTNGPNPVTSAGDVIDYTVVVTNTGNQTLTNVNTSDVLPDGSAGTLSAAVETGGTGTNGDGLLDVGEVWTYTISYTVTQSDIDAGLTLTNTATVDTDQTEPQQDGADTPVDQQPSLTIAKDQTNGPNPVTSAGDVIDYTVVVTNTGNQTLTNVNTSDVLPDGSAGTLSAAVETGGTGTNGDGLLDVGEVWTYTISYTVTQSDIDAGLTLTNTATVDTDQTEPQQDGADTPVDQQPSLTIAKDQTNGPNPVTSAGDVIDYTVVVTNTGNQTLTNVNTSDVLPDGSAGTLSAAVETGGTGTNGDGLLDVGEVWTYTISYTVTQSDIDAGLTLTNTATVDTDQTEPQQDGADTPVDQQPSLTIAKDQTNGPNPVTSAGDVIDYTVVVTNTGNQTLTNVNTSDVLPDGSAGTLSAAVETGGTGTNGDGLLDVGEVWTYTISYTVTQSDIDAGLTLTNTATVDTDQTEPQQDGADTPVDQQPSLTIAKDQTNGPNPVTSAGDVIDYTVVVTNTGNQTLTNVNTSDVLPDGSAGTLSAAVETGGTGTNGDGLLDVGEVWTYTISYTVTQSDIDAGLTLTNTATVDTDQTEPQQDGADTPVDQQPSLTIAKDQTNGPNPVTSAGDVIDYTVVVTNTGNQTLTNVNTSDVLPDGSAGTLSAAVETGGTGTNGDGLLDVGEVWTYTISYTVTQSDIDAGLTLTNTATVDTDQTEPQQDGADTPVDQQPSLTIAKDQTNGPNPVTSAGDVIDYTVVVTNTGNQTLTNVNTSDVLPDGSAGTLSAAVETGGTGTNGDGLLDVGEVWTYTISYTVTQSDIDAGLTLTNTATVDTDQTEPQQDGADTPVDQQPSLTIAKDQTNGPNPVTSAGDVIDYTVVVTNTGNQTLTNVNTSDVLPDGSAGTLSAAVETGGTGTNGDGLLDVGEVWTYTISYTVTQSDIDAGLTLTNTATVDTDQTEPQQDGADTPVDQQPSLTIAKDQTNGPNPVTSAGDVIDYTVVVTNTGNQTLTNVNTSDVLPDGSAGTLSAAVETGGTGTNGDGLLDVGEVWTYTISYTVTQSDIDAGLTLTNTATVDTDQTEPQQDGADTPVDQQPSLTIAKDQTNGPNPVTSAGDVIDYTVVVTNTGNQTLTNVNTSDVLPDGSAGTLSAAVETGGTGTNGDGLLDVGEVWTYTISYTVTQSDIDAGLTLTNTATVDTDQTEPQQDGADTPVDQQPSLTIAKDQTNGPNPVTSAGDVIDYTVVVTNTGNQTLTNVNTSDVLPDGSAGTLSAAVETGGTGTNGDGLLDVGEVWTYTISYTVTQSDIDAGLTLTNTATVDTDQTEPQQDGADTPVDQQPSLTIAKDQTNGPNPVTSAGDVIDYTVVVTNTGNQTLTNVNTSDVLPDGSAGTLSAAVETGGTGTNGDGLLDVGEVWTYTISYTVTQSDIDAGLTLTNTATVDTDQTEPQQDGADTPVDQQPSISIVKTGTFNDENGDGFADVGETISYVFAVSNDGNVTLTNVTVSDANPLVTVTGGPTTLDVGETDDTTFSGSYTITQADIDLGKFDNTATADSDESDPATGDETTTLPQNPLISIVKTFTDDSVIAGGDGSSFTLVVKNEGNVTLSDVLIEDMVDSRLSVTSVYSIVGSDADSDSDVQTVEWLISSLAPNASATITVEFEVDASIEEANGVGGVNDEINVPNNAFVGAEAPHGDPDNEDDNIKDESKDFIDILVDINLSIVKTFDPADIDIPAPQGTLQTFTIEVSNTGPSNAYGVSITDLVDPILEITNITATSLTTDCSNSTGNNLNCTVDIPAGGSETITVEYVTAPFLDADSPYNTTDGGDDFYFVFVNGSILEGTTRGEGVVILDGVDITNLSSTAIVRSLSRNDIIIDPDGDGPDPAFELHLSCSDPFTGGWGQSAGPVEGVDTNWQIAYFTIARFNNNGFLKSCGNVVNEFEVDNIADASGEDSFETHNVSDDDFVTIGPGITLDRLQNQGKRLTARLNNLTGGDRIIDEVTINWPDNNGNLKKVWLTYGNTSNIIWQGNVARANDYPNPDALLDQNDSGWEGGILPIGEAILRFDFASKVGDTGYTIRVHFEDGTWLDINVEGESEGARTSKTVEDSNVVEESKVMEPSVAEEETTMVIYPNPAITTFSINLEGYTGEFAEILLFDLNGRQLLRVKEKYTPGSPLQINLPYGLNEGLYYVKLNDGSSMLSQPIIIKKE